MRRNKYDKLSRMTRNPGGKGFAASNSKYNASMQRSKMPPGLAILRARDQNRVQIHRGSGDFAKSKQRENAMKSPSSVDDGGESDSGRGGRRQRQGGAEGDATSALLIATRTRIHDLDTGNVLHRAEQHIQMTTHGRRARHPVARKGIKEMLVSRPTL
jgi:hypothetical protein